MSRLVFGNHRVSITTYLKKIVKKISLTEQIIFFKFFFLSFEQELTLDHIVSENHIIVPDANGEETD